jgi:hypothetical protein
VSDEHEHSWIQQRRDENDDRIRTAAVCGDCGAKRYGTFAKRLHSDGSAAWGPPGEWWYHSPEPEAPEEVSCNEARELVAELCTGEDTCRIHRFIEQAERWQAELHFNEQCFTDAVEAENAATHGENEKLRIENAKLRTACEYVLAAHHRIGLKMPTQCEDKLIEALGKGGA